METFSTVEVAILAPGTLVMLFLGSLSMFIGLETWQFRDTFWMKSRWNHHTLVSIHAFISFYVTVRCPAVVWVNVWIGQKEVDAMGHSQKAAKILEVLVSAAFTIGFVLLIGNRFWSHYYKANLAVKVGVSKWKQMIDQSLVDESVESESSWFLKNRNTWGNRMFVFKNTVAIWFVLMLCAFAFAWTSLTLYQFSLSAICIVGLAMAVLLRWKYPKFDDRIFLIDEAKNITHIAICYMCIWFVLVFTGHFTKAGDDKHRMIYALLIVSRRVFDCCMLVAAQFTMANLVIVKFVPPAIVACGVLPLTFPTQNRPRFNTTSSLRSSNASRDRKLSDAIGVVHLTDVLRSKTGFRLFMAHLFKEFSTENMLCLIECTKFKDKYKMTGRKSFHIQLQQMESTGLSAMSRAATSVFSIDSLTLFCEEVYNTQSTTVNKLDENNSDEVVQELAERYLYEDATQCVNLSFRTRSNVLKCIASDKKLDEDVFDEVISECTRLLKDSFARFECTDEFATLAEDYKHELQPFAVASGSI